MQIELTERAQEAVTRLREKYGLKSDITVLTKALTLLSTYDDEVSNGRAIAVMEGERIISYIHVPWS